MKRLLWISVAAVAMFELYAASLVLRPTADATYRAYYIDRSSDCWPHRTPATYTLGTTLMFSTEAGARYEMNKICGWFYPQEAGNWSYGPYSLLRFVFPPTGGDLVMTLVGGGMVDAAHPTQHVLVSANGTSLGTLSFDSLEPATKTLTIPAALAASGTLELRFDYPDARPGTEIGPNEDSHLRALRVQSLTIAPA